MGGLIPDTYSIFDPGSNPKDIVIWQPSGTVDDITTLPTPEPAFQEKAGQFLQRATENGCHLGAAPEWTYNIEWITNHVDYLFAADSPLFVLGCAPIRDATRQEVIATLEVEYNYDVYEATDVDCSTDEFLTPTIIPIKAAAREGSDNNAVLVQYKNQPMSDGVLANEQANLAMGDCIWKIDPRHASTVIGWTCSDIMDGDLRGDVQSFARQNDTIVVHVQCNPGPFNETWIDFRNQIFDGSDNRVTYVCANWANDTFDSGGQKFGYSGVYTKAKRRSPLDRYDTTYENGGLVGTKPGYRCDYVWLMPNDIVSGVQFKQQNPGTTGAGASSFSLPRVYQTWTWDSGASKYLEGSPGVPECNDTASDTWCSQLPDSPLARELIATIALGKIDFDQLPDENLVPNIHFNWKSLMTLTDADGTERLGHVLSSHPRRTDPSPKEEVERLVRMLEKAAELNICMDGEFSLEDVPMNAEYEDKDIRVCLTVLGGWGNNSEQKGATRLNNWIKRRTDTRFKPLIVTMDRNSGLVLKTLEGHEDASRVDHDPERVSSPGGLVRVDR
ncbi:hypothetical protein NKF26_23325 [Haladaptatus sp. AB618]|uniref:hypothetical protein n=1 Tax=Haladaptatus sp. AB618 TaxID=2934173 RepID=UPI00209C3218|nr:hypothetical protein [Haladaptatus sp. AB618]MCO8256757.1 hypothetical protein [Haladaptatus sp. AB618]